MESVKKAGSAIRTFLINGFSRNKAENFLPRDNSKTDKGFAPVLRVNYIKRYLRSFLLVYKIKGLFETFMDSDFLFATLMRADLLSSAEWRIRPNIE